MNTPKKLDFGTAVNFQLEAKTTVYGKQKQEDALLIALIFKGFIQQDLALQYFASDSFSDENIYYFFSYLILLIFYYTSKYCY